MTSFYSNGKLLITGEYLVLDGAKSLSLPTKFGQNLTVNPLNESKLVWESYTSKNELWLQIEFDVPRLRIITETFDSNVNGGNDSAAINLQNVLLVAKKMNPSFLSDDNGYCIKSNLSFPRDWGLGSSSTLINNIAQWAKVDAFELLFESFGGSGYDIASAQHNTPILYQLINQKPTIKSIDFNPKFKEQLYFVYLNKKQNSREGIAKYRRFDQNKKSFIEEASTITDELIHCSDIKVFENLLERHEHLISSIISQKTVQESHFSDYFGQTKSLGAWGGDFIIATGNSDTSKYFKQKGFTTVISYEDMIL